MIARRFVLSLVLLCSGLIGSSPVFGQLARYELGRRLRGVEIVWAKADAEAKARALPSLKQAVSQFFSFKLVEAARSLDGARLRVEGHALDGVEAWGSQWVIEPEWRFGPLVEKASQLRFTIRRFYPVATPDPDDARIEISIVDSGGAVLVDGGLIVLPPGTEPIRRTLVTDGVPSGDYTLRVDVVVGDQTVVRNEVAVSLVHGLDQRLTALERTLDDETQSLSLERATASRLARFLRQLREGVVLETDFPATAMLSEAENAVRLESGSTLYDANHPGEFWLQVPIGRRRVAARIMSPPVAGKQLRPCVLALHGAGGSDNLFFEGYGNGAAIDLARKRGWVVIAPRSPLVGGAVDIMALVDGLTERYQLDPKRVFLLGHSMGAGHALGAARKAPKAYAAMALIGGGRPSRNDGVYKSIPTFISAGSEDFGLRGARGLYESLQKHSADVRFEVREGIEHLTIVQEALPDVFRFFDTVLSAEKVLSPEKQ